MATTTELVAQYNEAAKKLGEKTVKRFSTKDAAERRVKAIRAKLTVKGGSSTPAKTSGGKPRGRAIEPIDWKCGGEIVPVRKGTVGEKFVKVMNEENGASHTQLRGIMERQYENPSEAKNIAGRVRALLLKLHNYNGYGIRTLPDGRLRLVSRKTA